MPIVTNTPVETPPFDKVWVHLLQFDLPGPNQAGLVQVTFLPFNGTHVLDLPDKHRFQFSDPERVEVLQAMRQLVYTEMTRLVGNKSGVRSLRVEAPSPAQPVRAMVIFTDGGSRRIGDCYALAAKDPVFGLALQGILARLAVLGGYGLQ